MRYLLDTNVLSELQRPKPDDELIKWFDEVEERWMCTSVIVIGEIKRGIESLRRRDPAQAARRDPWYDDLVAWGSERLLPVTLPIMVDWARMSVPDPLPALDGLIAATARVHDLAVVTRNVADFKRAGVAIVNPFDPRLPTAGTVPAAGPGTSHPLAEPPNLSPRPHHLRLA
ncbi:type II toxin-antitoxin system VapC family toxin [Phytomonospora sp. NPDC050363]|uniref:type II toxin-antitoxin system VapC family toxin n=1 Tax=Phytomonospora sp. NPDC050363 TaxID=3155642 RepID=UPI0033C4D13F